MRLSVRRAVGVAGATAVAIGAALVLALPASAHNHDDSAVCDGPNAVFTVNLVNYNGSKNVKNSVLITDTPDGGQAATLVDNPSFGSGYKHTFTDQNATIGHTFYIKVVAADGSAYSFTDSPKTPPCVKTSPPPTSTTTKVPPTATTTPATTTPVRTTTGSTTTTSAVAVAATSTTPVGTGTLPYTGVNVALPLGIAGVLVIAGGGLLLWLRFNARRRNAG